MTKKRIIIALVVVLLVVVAALLFLPGNSKGATQTYITTTATSQNITQSITATGTIEPVTTVDVGTQVSGILTTLYVDYNSVVTEGQIIAELDKSTLQLDLNNCISSLAAAKSKYQYEKANYNRIKELHNSKLISDSEYETALYSYEQATSSYETSKVSLERAKINLEYATITSPINGVVLSRSVEEGQTVASSFSTPTLFSIAADLKDMRVIADVDEADIGNVREGQRVSFTVDAYPTETFEGFVTQVRQEAIITSNVVTYEVVISAANPDLKLKPGLTASVEIFVLDVTCDMVVSAAAFSFTPDVEVEAPQGRPEGMGRPDGGMGMPMGERPSGERPSGAKPKKAPKEGNMIWVKKGDSIEPRPVRTGITNGILTEIVAGIEPTDSVIIGTETVTVVKASTTTTEENPFMPKRPGSNKK